MASRGRLCDFQRLGPDGSAPAQLHHRGGGQAQHWRETAQPGAGGYHSTSQRQRQYKVIVTSFYMHYTLYLCGYACTPSLKFPHFERAAWAVK